MSHCTTDAAAAAKNLKHKRRFCKAPDCGRIVKSQGLCQRHGAKPRKCKIDVCTKQAQGNYDGMCKSHFKQHKRNTTPLPKKPDMPVPPPPQGESVYDSIIPASLVYTRTPGTVMPLVEHLRKGFTAGRPPAWHRNEERLARGHWPVDNAATQLEGWERELVWTEILLLTGNEDSSFRHLARAWGRDKGFQRVLSQFICDRRGNVERKKRVKSTTNVVRADSQQEYGSAAGADGAAHPNEAGTADQEDGDYDEDQLMDLFLYGDAAFNDSLAADLELPLDSNGNPITDPTLLAYRGNDLSTTDSGTSSGDEDYDGASTTSEEEATAAAAV